MKPFAQATHNLTNTLHYGLNFSLTEIFLSFHSGLKLLEEVGFDVVVEHVDVVRCFETPRTFDACNDVGEDDVLICGSI